MRQYFSHYLTWEDWNHGLYSDHAEEALINESKNLLCDYKKFWNAMENLDRNWPISTMVNLTNIGLNRRAWLGQASCCISHKAPAETTKFAWWEMTPTQRKNANECANRFISKWEIKYILSLSNSNQLTIF